MSEFVETECAIRQLHARFVDAVWRQDAECFARCFDEDGEWKIAGLNMRGRAEIASNFSRLLGLCERVQLLLGAPLLDVAAQGVTGRMQVTELAKLKDGTSALTLGVYYDRYKSIGSEWVFTSRHWVLHYRGPVDLSGPILDGKDYGAPPAMPDPDEPSVGRKV